MSIESINLRGFRPGPGVYLFKDRLGEVLYVGKSVNVKDRIGSHLASQGEKSKRMISQTQEVSVIPVESELESLLLEAKLIKDYLPKYNSAAKDDRSPLYIKITKDDFPVVATARGKDLANSVFFGPFPSSGTVRSVLRKIRRVFPYHSGVLGKRPCLYSHLGLCNPCPNTIEKLNNENEKKKLKNGYKKNIVRLIKLLSGESKSLRNDLVHEMKNFAESQDFEKASQLRDQISSLDYITSAFKSPGEYLRNPNLLEDQRREETKSLYEVLSTRMKNLHTPKRIECFDVSQLSGRNPTGSMVTFTNGEPNKDYYRHFTIQDTNTRDDFAMIKEIVRRRLKHTWDWGKPDLIVIDGGRGQVSVARSVILEKGCDIPLIGLAKRLEEIVIPKENQKFIIVRLKEESPALHLLQRVRDESHRFARRLHFKHRLKEFKKS